MGPRLRHRHSKRQWCWQRGLGVDATRRCQGRGGVMPCGVGTQHIGMEWVSECKTKRNKKNELTKWHTQMHAVAGVDEPGRGEGEVDTASSWLRRRRRVGARLGGMSRCQVWATLGKQEWAEGDNRKKKKLLTYNENYPRPMPWALTRHRGMALTKLEEVRGVGLTWHVAGEGQPWKRECKQRETTEKKHLHGWGMDNGAQRLGQHSRVPGKDVSKEKKKKKIKKNSCKGEAMCAAALGRKVEVNTRECWNCGTCQSHLTQVQLFLAFKC